MINVNPNLDKTHIFLAFLCYRDRIGIKIPSNNESIFIVLTYRLIVPKGMSRTGRAPTSTIYSIDK